MAFFKSKDEKERQKEEIRQKNLNDFLTLRKLEDISAKDKEVTEMLMDLIEDRSIFSTKGSEAEIRQLELMSAISEQNFMIIRLLNEISDKLNK